MLKSTEEKVLVTGATGYVGKNLVNYLIKNSYKVYVLTRKESSVFTNKNNVTVIVGDITDPIALPEDINTIYHCAGVITDTNEMERVNVQGTQNIVNIALQNKCKLIHLSSAGIIGKTKTKTLTEETECHPHNLYELSKYKAEQIVLRGVTNGLKAQILRPTTIFGFKEDPKKDTFFQLAKSMRTGLYRNIGNGIYNIVHIDEVVMALIMLDEEGLSNGGVYQVNNTITYEDMNILVKNLEPTIKNTTQTIPYPVAYIATIALTIICFIIHKKNPLTFSRLRALTNTKIYSQRKIGVELDFKNIQPIEDHIIDVCKQYIAKGLMS